MENENKELEKKENKEIATLGDGQVFIKRTPSGAIKSVCANLKLREAERELVDIQGSIVITADGYKTLNKIASISIITPEKLTLPNGDIVVNPYLAFDQNSASLEKIWVRKLAIGYSPIGNLVITSATLLYDLKMYFIQDIVKKLKSNKAVGRITTENLLTEEEKSTGIFMPVQGKLGVYANLQNIEALKCFDTFLGNKIHGGKKAETICERNALKKHPALAFSKVQAAGPEKHHEAWIKVVGWNSDLTEVDYKKLATMYENGEITSNYKGINVESYEVSGSIGEEDLKASKEEYDITNDEDNTVHQLSENPSAQPMQQVIINNDKEKVETGINNSNNTSEQQQFNYTDDDIPF